MKKFRLLFFSFLLVLTIGCGKEKIDTNTYEEKNSQVEVLANKSLSETILIGRKGHSSYGTWQDQLVQEIRIMKDKTAQILVEGEVIATTSLTIEQYQAIEPYADIRKMAESEITVDDEEHDGGDYYIVFYGKDEKEIESFGGYMPSGEWFDEVTEAIFQNLPENWINESVVAYQGELTAMANDNTLLLTEKFKNQSEEFEGYNTVETMMSHGCKRFVSISDPVLEGTTYSFQIKADNQKEYLVKTNLAGTVEFLENISDHQIVYQ